MQRPGQPAKFIPNALIYKGYLVMIRPVGRGKSWEKGGMFDGEGDTWTEWERYEDVMQPLFDGAKVTEELKVRLKSLESIHDVFTAGMEQYLLKFGTHGGYIISNQQEEEMQQIASEKEVSFRVHNCWETGINWYQLIGRYPADVFSEMKAAGLFYHAEQEEDGEEGNWKGWCVTHNLKEIHESLARIGWKIEHYED